jgi:hypothetical protein
VAGSRCSVTGGHAAELRTALVRLGADPETLALPADLTGRIP